MRGLVKRRRGMKRQVEEEGKERGRGEERKVKRDMERKGKKI